MKAPGDWWRHDPTQGWIYEPEPYRGWALCAWWAVAWIGGAALLASVVYLGWALAKWVGGAA